MEQAKLGQLLSGNEGRDAVHVCVIPVQAAQTLLPGQRVTVKNGRAWIINGPPTGIVDPFLDVACVYKDEWCYILPMPGTITNMRHVWSHPDFPTASERLKAIQKDQAQ